ncbi:6061_t:CDS:1, partial [Gigaspora rosea]
NILNDANSKEELLENVSEVNSNQARDVNIPWNEDLLVNPNQQNNPQQNNSNPQTLQLFQIIAIAFAGPREP